MSFVKILLMFWLIPCVLADDANEKMKSKIVSRMYQATFGANEYCQKALPETRKAFEDTLARFVSKNTKLVKLIEESPYYEQAKATMQSNKYKKVEDVDNDCKGLNWMLGSMLDTENGQKALTEYETILLK